MRSAMRAVMTRFAATPGLGGSGAREHDGERLLPLSFAPGEAYQFDWSHDIVVMDGNDDREGRARSPLP